MPRLPWICAGIIFKGMKRILFIILVPLVFMSACKSDSDILAEMDGTVITRGEFRDWLNSKGIPLENIMQSRSAYIMNLEQLGVEKLTSGKALENNFDKDPYFIKLHDIIYRNYTAAYFRDYIYDNMDFNETAADESSLEDVKKHLLEAALERIEKNAFDSFNVKSYITEISYSRGSEVIFSVSGETFTVKDLNDILEIFYELKYGSKPLKKMTKENKILTSRRILSETLQFREAIARGIHKDSEFVKRWDMLKRSALSGAYKYRTLADAVAVTAADVSDEYRSNLNKRYYRIQERGGAHIKVPIPFSEVRESISHQLFRDKMTSVRKKWDKSILSESNFVINESLISAK